MKRFFTAFLLLGGTLQAGLVPITSHLDGRWEFREGEWDFKLRTSVYTAEPNQDPATVFEADEAFLALSDKPYVTGSPAISGARFTQPGSATFAFTGASSGDPIWLAVQGTPGDGEAWPGIDNDQLFSDFGAYIPDDPRVSQASPWPYIRISLVNYQPPHGKTSDFSMWNTFSFDPPKVWMSTFDTDVEDSFYYVAGGHDHVWWGFTATGIHRITFEASAFLGPGATNPTGPSDPYTVTFAVGTVARWQATWFDADELDDPAISGLDADPDDDGLVNLIEYAFGTNPRLGGPVPVEEGLGLPVFSLVDDGGTLYEKLTYPRRRAGDRLEPEIYQPEFSGDLSGSWNDTGVVTTAGDFDPPLDSLNDEWELVTSRRVAPVGVGRGFARVDVTAGDGF